MPEIDKIEMERRIRAVAEWIVDGWNVGDIIASIKSKWNIEQRQSERYLKYAREHLAQFSDETLAEKKARMIARLEKNRRSLKDEYKGTPEGLKVILAIDKELIKLEGLDMPLKIAHQNPDGTPLHLPQVGEIAVHLLPSDIAKQIYAARPLIEKTEYADFIDVTDGDDTEN